MNQFVLQQDGTGALQIFPHILELGVVKNISFRLNAFQKKRKNGILLYYIIDGKFEWTIDKQSHKLFPGDAILVLPEQEFGNEESVLEIGSFTWIHIKMPKKWHGQILPGKWSSLTIKEWDSISNILLYNNSPLLSKFPDLGKLLKKIQSELSNKEIGFISTVNHLIDDLFIQLTRQLTRQINIGRDFPKTFMNLDQTLRQNLSEQWTVEQMAALVGIGTTQFNEKVKNFTGFSPITYLINIRISEAIKLLKQADISLTDIALNTGFYSSQHFSTTFKKLTGYTPSEFRKNNSTKN